MDESTFRTLMMALSSAKRVEVTEALLMGYWIGCDGLTDGDFGMAVKRALQEADGMPSPHELRKLAGEEQVETQAIHAWATVLRSIGAHGSYASVDFGPLVNSVIRSMGGWVELCSRDSEELREWGRKEFEATYRKLAGSSLVLEMGEHLAGICERSNTRLGVAANVVRLLSAKQKSRLAVFAADDRRANA